jgi:hypothetical protein
MLSFSQENEKKDSISVLKIKLFNSDYKDFEIIKNTVYALTKGGVLVLFDLKKEKIIRIIDSVIAITKCNKKEVVYIKNDNEIIGFKSGIKEKIPAGFVLYRLLYDNKNNSILITDKGLVYRNKRYNPSNIKYSYRFYFYKSQNDRTKVFHNPDLVYLDSHNRLWLTYDNGEFGEDILFFDLEKKEFYESDYLYLKDNSNIKDFYNSKEYEGRLLDSFPDKIKKESNKLVFKFPNNLPIRYGVKGISENKNGEIFISQSLMHFTVSGQLNIIKETSISDFYTSINLNDVLEYMHLGEKNKLDFLKEYLGTNTFNIFDNSFYYYSDKGFFKIIKNGDKYSKQLFFKPLITWTAGLANSVGYQMNVIKFEFISEKEIIFLTLNNGIGYFDGETVKYFK